MDTDKTIIEALQLTERAKQLLEDLRMASLEGKVDGRALSIAMTYLETCQLWIANARV